MLTLLRTILYGMASALLMARVAGGQSVWDARAGQPAPTAGAQSMWNTNAGQAAQTGSQSVWDAKAGVPAQNGSQVSDAPAAPYQGPPVQFPSGPNLPSPSGALDAPTVPAFTPAGYAPEAVQPLVDEFSPPPAPTGARRGAFQRLAVSGAWLPRGDTGLGSTDVGIEATFAFPMPTPESPLLWTPAFEMHYLDGPDSPDLPEKLYDASWQVRWLSQLTPIFGVDLAITPGWHGDFEETKGDAIRFPARALGVWDCSPSLKLVLGALYLDREDVNWLPAGGVIWTPTDDHRLEAVFPRPRYAWRWYCDDCHEQWWYVAGEFGGGSYSIRRATGELDIVTLSDMRLIYGLECSRKGGATFRYEFAYVFAREVEYESATPDFEPDDTAMLRIGLTY